MSIKQQVTKSVFWSAVERFSVQGVQFILSLIIARLLLPADYGLIAMLSIFMSIAQTFIDSGFANALIQKKDRTDADYSTVFYFNIVISVLIYLLLYMSSPWIAKFYEEDQLAPIARGIGLTLIINSFGIVQQAKMTISLDFKRQAQASLSAVVLSGGVGVWLAYSGYGAWALVYQSLLNNFFRVVLVWFFSGWMRQEFLLGVVPHVILVWLEVVAVLIVTYFIQESIYIDNRKEILGGRAGIL